MQDLKKLEEALGLLGESQLACGECFGGHFGIIRDGEVAFEGFFGDERFKSDSIYRLASVSKLFCAAAVMKLYGEGRLDIHASVSEYLCGFDSIALGEIYRDGRIYPVGLPKRGVTVFDLLTHTAGLGASEVGSREYAMMPDTAKVSLESAVKHYIDAFHLAFEPGSRFAYSGFAGYDCLARIIEVVTGKSYNSYLTEAFFEPLELFDTTFLPTDEQYARIVPMHRRAGGVSSVADFKGSLFRGIPRTYEAAGAALISSMHDMLRFCRMLLCGGEGIIKEECVELMLSPSLCEGLEGLPKGESSGFGCFAITGEHRLKIGTVYCHGAYGTHVLLDYKNKNAAIFLKNSLYDMSEVSHSTVQFEKAVK